MKLKNQYLILLFFILGLGACGSDKGKNIPDVSHISVDLNIHRFEKELFSIDTSNVKESLVLLEKKYPDFSSVYFQNVLGLQRAALGEERYYEAVKGFLTFPAIRKLADTTSQIYSSFTEIEADLKEVFRYYKYHFPDQPVLDIYTYISEYAYGAFVGDGNILGIGLDFFLGVDYPYYDPAYFPKYIRKTMNKDYIVMRAVEAMANDLCGNPKGERMIDFMVNNGKKLYIMDQLMPYAPDSIKLAYSQKQVDWCENNEMQVWAHFLAEELLYSTSYKDIRKLVDQSPNSPGMPPEAPGRTANWIGWQIVESYMARYPDTKLEGLIAIEDAQQLLERSKYKPKR